MGNSIDKILPGLHVGNIRGGTNKKVLDENRITHILSIHDKADPVVQDRIYLCIKANDVANQDLSQYFSQCIDFIHNARVNNGNVLVHCVAGMSRSVTVTTAYIMTVTKLGWREALNAVRGGRRCANPNYGFQRQLLAFYHDRLPAEKKRLSSSFPPSPYPDQEECEKLIAQHQHWVLHGDEVQPDDLDDSQTTYPLSHNAYKRNVKTIDTAVDASYEPIAPACDESLMCNSCKQNPVSGDVTISCDNGGLLCDQCKQEEDKTFELLSSAPDVQKLEQPSDGASTSSRTEAMDTCEELVNDMFANSAQRLGTSVDATKGTSVDKHDDATMGTKMKISKMKERGPVIFMSLPSREDPGDLQADEMLAEGVSKLSTDARDPDDGNDKRLGNKL